MGKVIVLISTTPDGFADADNVIIDPEFFEFTQKLMDGESVIAFGRHTFEMFQERWPQRLQDKNAPNWVRKMAQSLHDIHKFVFSSTLKETTWHNSSIIPKLDADYIRNFKQSSSGAMLTFGSLSLVETLIQMNAVDDYYFNVQPLLPGKGAHLFNKAGLKHSLALKYIDCKPLPSGSLIVHYEKAL